MVVVGDSLGCYDGCSLMDGVGIDVTSIVFCRVCFSKSNRIEFIISVKNLIATTIKSLQNKI